MDWLYKVDFAPIFDGIWAAASLVHVPSYELEGILNKFKKALMSEGILYTSFKYGDFEILKMWITEDILQTHVDEKWLNILVQNQC